MTTSTTPETEAAIYRLTDHGLSVLRDRLAKYAKRADKLGVPAPTCTVHDTVSIEVEDDFGKTGEVRVFHLVTVAGDSPVIDGWRLVAVVDRDPETQPGEPFVVNAVPGETIEQAWRFLGDVCDHCAAKDGHYVPRGRRKIVVLRDETDAVKFVGLTCVRDFLGSASPDAIASWAEVLTGLGDLIAGIEETDREPGAYGERRYAPDYFLAWTAATIRTDGWTSKGQSSDFRPATVTVASQRIEDARTHRRYRGVDVVSPDEYPTDADVELADAALAWASELPIDNGNDYLDNVRAVAGKLGWRARDLGLGASIVSTFGREVAVYVDAVAKSERVARGEVAPVPNDGGRQVVTGTVVKVDTKANDFGTRLVFTVRDDRGFSVWGTVPSALCDIPAGDEWGYSREVEAGERVTFTAKLERSDRDETFGFFTRPTKAALLADDARVLS